MVNYKTEGMGFGKWVPRVFKSVGPFVVENEAAEYVYFVEYVSLCACTEEDFNVRMSARFQKTYSVLQRSLEEESQKESQSQSSFYLLPNINLESKLNDVASPFYSGQITSLYISDYPKSKSHLTPYP